MRGKLQALPEPQAEALPVALASALPDYLDYLDY